MSNEYSIPSYTQSNASAHHQSSHEEKNHRISSTNYHQSNMGHQSQMPELTQDLCNALLNQQASVDTKKVLQNVNSGWQSLAPSAAVADYLAQLPTSTLPLSLHHFLKYSSESIKKEVIPPRRFYFIYEFLLIGKLKFWVAECGRLTSPPECFARIEFKFARFKFIVECEYSKSTTTTSYAPSATAATATSNAKHSATNPFHESTTKYQQFYLVKQHQHK